ncbi:MAG TPA: hybrid sensor histidine kinase/response regulator [Actinomycetota bacterium]|nr:hybrid sensor histidine kinase/response regulator [Actinomycetota bacterium]
MPTRVLLCDTPDGLAQLQYALMKSGGALEVEVVTDGLRAVEVAARTQPALVVTEIGLEGLNGTDLIRRLLATVPETSVVCWTNVPSPVAMAQMLHAGASAYLLKEDGPEAVLRAMRAVLDGNVALSHRVGSQIAARLVGEAGQRRDLEVALGDVSERLESLTSAKAEFLANVSHELRTPVTVAKGIAYVLKNRGIPREEQQEFLDQLEAALEKLMMLVDEMLTVAEMDRGTLTLRLTQVDIAPILRHVAEEIGRQHPPVPIRTEIPDALEGAADPVRLAEAVRQLLDNACRYSSAGSEVVLKGRTMTEGIAVSVTDHGEGLPRDVAAQAFREPFTAGEEILRKERAGVGVGLHLARQIVLQHGGILWADPLPAGGTRVAFIIPAHQGEKVSRPPTLGDAESDTGPAGPPPGGNVLPFGQRTSTASSS